MSPRLYLLGFGSLLLLAGLSACRSLPADMGPYGGYFPKTGLMRDGLVQTHRDYWDLLSSFASSVPLLSRAHGWLMKKIA